ncbi:rRNA maturation RNase YbeY [Candidatus Parcubacteria bacterium]|nr:rRNA maturation RNase YbeY [Candidatus Parcubacteria bacterium]
MQRLNKRHCKEDRVTDVLSFEMAEELPNGTFYLGDVVVALGQARKQAKKLGHSLEEEVAELVKHGVLHLLGKHHVKT